MGHTELYQLLERVGNLLRTEARRSSAAFGLQPVHVEALHFLSRCNRYSDTPAAVTEYLGATKGTVSQTLGVLERKGLIEKKTDVRDRRVQHLKLSKIGRSVLTDISPSEFFDKAVSRYSRQKNAELTVLLKNFLKELQLANRSKSFGVCNTCRFFKSDGAVHQCGLTLEPLDDTDFEKFCREHLVEERETRIN